MGEKEQKLSRAIIKEVDGLYQQMIQNSGARNSLSYMDICQLADHVEERLEKEAGEVPKGISGAAQIARGVLNPDRADSRKMLKKGIALLSTTGGGLLILFGILSSLTVGSGLIAWVGSLIFGVTTPVLGPIAVALGLASLVGGIYYSIHQMSPTQLSAKAHDIIVRALRSWGNEQEEKARLKDEHTKLVIESKTDATEPKMDLADMSRDERECLFVLIWAIANADEEIQSGEQVLIDSAGSAMNVKDYNTIAKKLSKDPSSSASFLASSKNLHEYWELLHCVARADGEIQEAEIHALKLIASTWGDPFIKKAQELRAGKCSIDDLGMAVSAIVTRMAS